MLIDTWQTHKLACDCPSAQLDWQKCLALHSLGKAEVDSSILSGGTIFSLIT